MLAEFANGVGLAESVRVVHQRRYKAERPEIRVVPKGKFLKLDTIEAVVHALFGEVETPE